MIRRLIYLLRDVRLVPVVLVAIIALFALKALGLILDGGYLFEPRDDVEVTGLIATNAAVAPSPVPAVTVAASQPAPKPSPQRSWAQEMFNYPSATGAVGTPDVPKEELAAAKPEGAPKKPVEPAPTPSGTPVQVEPERNVSPAERAILESLQKRRAELDQRAHELDVREDLLRAAEKRLEGRVMELKDLESRVDEAVQQKDQAEVARFKNVVAMYENMKAKDAAKIFDGLDLKVLLDVVKQINPRRMSDILGQMSPETAQRLTTELAARSSSKDATQPADLPKIQGRPGPN
jgi:flagellar motility protein MotE (MotC chaperone)